VIAMSSFVPALLVPVALLAGACGGGGGDDGAPGGGGGPDAAGGLDPCPSGTLCLEVTEAVPGEPLASGRLAVVWHQLAFVNRDYPPKLAYDAPFEPGAARYDIPLTSLTLPDDEQLLCQWEADGCHRDSSPRAVGFGLVMVVEDNDGNGVLEDEELSPYLAVGASFAYVAWSADARAAGSDDLTTFDGEPNYMGAIFPAGIRAGINGYDTVATEDFEFALTPLAAGASAELVVCPATSQCSITIPRLVGRSFP
jgi:hypothetical protein